MTIKPDISGHGFWPDPGRPPRRVLAAMSGGIDSTFAAWILKQSGAEVMGVHFLLGDLGGSEDPGSESASAKNASDARTAAEQLEIPFHEINAADEFRKKVIEPFARSYACGLTPNPCVVCNPRIKWRLLLQMAAERGADAVATGHYARVVKDPEASAYKLLRAKDRTKDQSYFLSRLGQDQLSRAVLPAGWYTKDSARALLASAGISAAEKQESQDICFAGHENYWKIVERILGNDKPPPGEIVDLSGKALGSHAGIHKFTVGQRKGLNVSAREPLYVVKIDPSNNRVLVGPQDALFSDYAMAEELNWICEPPDPDVEYRVKIRYKSRPAACKVCIEAPDRMKISFSQKQRAITPGQTAVLYQGDEVIGSGVIKSPAQDKSERNAAGDGPSARTGAG